MFERLKWWWDDRRYDRKRRKEMWKRLRQFEQEGRSFPNLQAFIASDPDAESKWPEFAEAVKKQDRP